VISSLQVLKVKFCVHQLPIHASCFANSMLFVLIIQTVIFCEHYKFIKILRCVLTDPPLICRVLAADILLGNFFTTVPFLFPQGDRPGLTP
jgi:hypothetical protein